MAVVSAFVGITRSFGGVWQVQVFVHTHCVHVAAEEQGGAINSGIVDGDDIVIIGKSVDAGRGKIFHPERGPRCALCFGYSLARAAQAADERGLPFSTSLTVSPHKPAALIAHVGAQFPNYEHWDFKKRDGFLRSIQLSRQLGLYRQAYCGCEFSWRDTQEVCHGCQSDTEP